MEIIAVRSLLRRLLAAFVVNYVPGWLYLVGSVWFRVGYVVSNLMWFAAQVVVCRSSLVKKICM